MKVTGSQWKKITALSFLFSVLMLVVIVNGNIKTYGESIETSNIHISSLFTPKIGSVGNEAALQATSKNLPNHLSDRENNGAVLYLTKNIIHPSALESKKFAISDNTKNDVLVRMQPTPLINKYDTLIKGKGTDGADIPVDTAVANSTYWPSIRDITLTIADANNSDIFIKVFWFWRADVGSASYAFGNMMTKSNNQNYGGLNHNNLFRTEGYGGALVPVSYWGNVSDIMEVYYDFEENSLYCIKVDSGGNSLGKQLLRNFNDTYGVDAAWGGFESDFVTISIEYSGGDGANNAVLVTDIDGLNLSTNDDGYIKTDAIESYNNIETSYEVKSPVISLSEGLIDYSLPMLTKANMLITKQMPDTADYTINVLNSQYEDVTENMVKGLDNGKWTETSIFSPLYADIYTFKYAKGNMIFESSATVYNEVSNILKVSYQVNSLLIEIPNASANNLYQFWMKTKLTVDNESDNLSTERYVWQIVQPFSDETKINLDITKNTYVIEGNYEILVRVKDYKGENLKDIHGLYNAKDIGQIFINSIMVNEKNYNDLLIIDNIQELVEISVFSNILGEENNPVYYALYNKDTIIGENTHGRFSMCFSGFKGGYHELKAVAKRGADTHEIIINVFVFDEFKSSEIAVIDSLEGVSDIDGKTTFTMKLKYADDSNILEEDFETKYNILLTSDNQRILPSLYKHNDNGVLEVVFDIEYAGYGVAHLIGSVGRIGVTVPDDKVIKYYYGHTRTATLKQDASTKTALVGTPISITANGRIENHDGYIDESDTHYAFYREDAAGWVLIRGYSSVKTLNWIPAKAGNYNIQARVKANDAINYEKTVTCNYIITSDITLDDKQLTLNVYDYTEGEEFTEFFAGKPYKIVANYSGKEDVLYLFTLQSKNLGVIYLNQYSYKNCIDFIPNKSDNYLITVRVINVESFGYKELSKSIEINSVVKNAGEKSLNVISGKVEFEDNYTIPDYLPKTPEYTNGKKVTFLESESTIELKTTLSLSGGNDRLLKLFMLPNSSFVNQSKAEISNFIVKVTQVDNPNNYFELKVDGTFDTFQSSGLSILSAKATNQTKFGGHDNGNLGSYYLRGNDFGNVHTFSFAGLNANIFDLSYNNTTTELKSLPKHPSYGEVIRVFNKDYALPSNPNNTHVSDPIKWEGFDAGSEVIISIKSGKFINGATQASILLFEMGGISFN